eukprot:78067_1
MALQRGYRSLLIPSRSRLFNHTYRCFSSLSPLQSRTTYEPFSPIQYNIINASENTPRITELESDLLVIPIYHDAKDTTPKMVVSPDTNKASNTDEKEPEPPLNLSQLFDFETIRLNQKHGNILSTLLSESQILKKESKFKHIIARICGDELPYSYPKKILVVSLGKDTSNATKTGNNLVPDTLQQTRGFCTIINTVMSDNKSFKSCSIYLPSRSNLEAQSLVESLNICTHKDTRFKFKTDSDTNETDGNKYTCTILTDKPGEDTQNTYDIQLGQSISSGIRYARELVNSPANVITPKQLAQSAQSLQVHSDYINIKVLDEQQCADLNMYSYLSVGACSNNAPHFIHLNLTAPDMDTSANKQKIVLIGKGVCFDSGGYNLKAGAGSLIENMKYDMAGSAAVIGTFAALSTYFKHNPSIAKNILDEYEIHGCVAACENMISGKEAAMHPGDIIQSAEGLSIEVTNTDAEGRLTLADAIWYGRNVIGADVVIDVATLTGAMKVATGKKIAGLFSNDDGLATDLLQSAYSSGERLWRMPLFDDCSDDNGENSYTTAMDSEIADLVNAEKGGSGGGAITAALFLKRFAESTKSNKKIPVWAHLDVAGPVWNDKKGHEQSNIGATGYGVRLLTNYVMNKCLTK